MSRTDLFHHVPETHPSSEDLAKDTLMRQGRVPLQSPAVSSEKHAQRDLAAQTHRALTQRLFTMMAVMVYIGEAPYGPAIVAALCAILQALLMIELIITLWQGPNRLFNSLKHTRIM
jgi:hypothetical protein